MSRRYALTAVGTAVVLTAMGSAYAVSLILRAVSDAIDAAVRLPGNVQ